VKKLLLCLFVSALALPALGQAATGKSLYDRLGGEPAIRGVVDDFVALTGANPKVNFSRGGAYQMSDAKLAQLKTSLTAFLAQAFGGPAKYAGKDMKTAHAGMKITKAEFDAMAGDLKTVLERHKVPKREIDEVLAIAASTAPQIVEAKD
jgi:hemoglobin